MPNRKVPCRGEASGALELSVPPYLLPHPSLSRSYDLLRTYTQGIIHNQAGGDGIACDLPIAAYYMHLYGLPT